MFFCLSLCFFFCRFFFYRLVFRRRTPTALDGLWLDDVATCRLKTTPPAVTSTSDSSRSSRFVFDVLFRFFRPYASIKDAWDTHTHTHTHTPTQKEKGRPTLVVIHWRASSQIPRRDRRFVLEPNPKKQQQQQQTNKVCEMADPSSRRASVGLLRRKTKKPNKQRRIGPKSATWFDCRPLDGARHVSAPSARFFTAATSWISAMIQWTTASRGRSIIEHPASDDYGPISAGVSYRKQRPNQAKANTARFEKPKQFDSVMLLLVTVHWTWRPSNMAGLCV